MTLPKQKTQLNQIANGDCPVCNGPLIDVDMKMKGFESVVVKLECDHCLSQFTATYDIVAGEKT